VKLDESYLARRRFLHGMLGGGALTLGAGASVPLLQYVGNFREEPPPEFLVLAAAEYDPPPGKAKMALYGRMPMLLLRTPEPGSELKVFVATCTHLNCTVHYREEQRCIVCACHGGYFDLDGRVVSGPPPQALRQFYHRVQDGQLVIALEQANLDKAS
jgi:Rieske Fe-S protein